LSKVLPIGFKTNLSRQAITGFVSAQVLLESSPLLQLGPSFLGFGGARPSRRN